MSIRSLLVISATSLLVTIASAEEAPWMPHDLGAHEAEYGPGPFGGDSADTMAIQWVSSIGVDDFYWYRNDSIDGDTFEIESLAENTAAPFQIALEVEGSWDLTVHSATSIQVYTIGVGTSAVSAGTLTLGDGMHVIFNDTAAGGSELHIDMPGPGASAAPPSTPSSPSGASSPSSSPAPTWDTIHLEHAHVEWRMVDGRLNFEFRGNNASSTLEANLHQAAGTGDIDVLRLGDADSTSLSLPAELVEDAVSVSSGHHLFEAGTSADGPWSLAISWGPHFCDEDLNRDGVVDFNDLLQLLYAWGSCP
ncbi:MAG: hypothetical protein MK101_09660 [Phycisphaerales bacterium]|nr:hypothetical protein [Phycisphaerales bacterium]